MNGDVLLLSVQDNGAGMSSDRLEALRKQLADPVTAMEATPGEGLGGNRSYGMLNVQARIKLTFGDEYGITIDSTENEGTTVVITHPLVHAVPSSSDHDGRQVMRRAYQVLIADDEPIIREGIRDAVDWEALGMEVVPKRRMAKRRWSLRSANRLT